MIDISMPVDAATPTWPGSPGVKTTSRMSLGAGDEANVTQLELDVHTGTHVDAPLHFVAGGRDMEAIGLDALVGPAIVVDTGDAMDVDAALLDALRVPAGTERLLFRTRNSQDPSWFQSPFREDYAALTADAATWVVEHGVRLVGIDALSIQRYRDPADTHQILLGADVCVVEGLVLDRVAPGPYDLVCLPFRLTGTEAAPARAVLLPIHGTTGSPGPRDL